jgi:hypothetical protein
MTLLGGFLLLDRTWEQYSIMPDHILLIIFYKPLWRALIATKRGTREITTCELSVREGACAGAAANAQISAAILFRLGPDCICISLQSISQIARLLIEVFFERQVSSFKIFLFCYKFSTG